jgi:hypothetical protein
MIIWSQSLIYIFQIQRSQPLCNSCRYSSISSRSGPRARKHCENKKVLRGKRTGDICADNISTLSGNMAKQVLIGKMTGDICADTKSTLSRSGPRLSKNWEKKQIIYYKKKDVGHIRSIYERTWDIFMHDKFGAKKLLKNENATFCDTTFLGAEHRLYVYVKIIQERKNVMRGLYNVQYCSFKKSKKSKVIKA